MSEQRDEKLARKMAELNVTISDKFPPVIDSIRNAFEINPKCYFTYGNTIHNPYNLPLPDDIIAHELVHVKQQTKMKPELWWGRYLRDKEFRVDQEARAYGRQYAWLCKENRDREARHRILIGLAKSLSGPLYANCIDFNMAFGAIKYYSK